MPSVIASYSQVTASATMSRTDDTYFSCTAWYYGDNSFIRTSDFIACSDIAHVTCTTDMDSRMTCSTKYRFESGAYFQLGL